MKEFSIDINISAPIEKVWETLVDFDNYENWNPVVPNMTGVLSVGNDIDHTIIWKNGESSLSSAKVDSVNPLNSFVLSKSHKVPQLARMVHFFELKSVSSESTRFCQRWQCYGLMTCLFWRKISNKLGRFNEFNETLKAHVEGKKS